MTPLQNERKALILLSHTLTSPQVEELEEKWKVAAIKILPESLQVTWSKIPPHLDAVAPHLEPVLSWMEEEGGSGDVAVIQGDFGAAYLAVKKALSLGITPLYATTRREVKEVSLPDGSVAQDRVFKHVRFRVYGR